MNILLVTQYFYPEERRINDIVKDMVKMGHKVTVLTEYPNYPQGEIYPGYGFDIPYEKDYFGATIVRLKAQPRKQGLVNLAINYLDFWLKGNKWAKKNGKDFDLVFFEQLSPVFSGFPALKIKKKFGTPYIMHVLDLWPESFMCVMHTNNKIIYNALAALSNKVYKNADKLLCTSKSFIDNLGARGIAKDKLIYWPQYAETVEDKNYPMPSEYKTKYQFVFTGNIGEAQGLDILIEVAEKLKENKDIGIYLVGDGRARERLEQIKKEKELDNLIFTGQKPIEEMPNYIKNATASILVLEPNELSKTTVPAKLQMYMACGSPVVCAIRGESGDVVEEAKCGFVCDYDSHHIVSTMLEIIEQPKEILEQMSKHGRKYVEDHYDYELVMNELKGYIDEFQK